MKLMEYLWKTIKNMPIFQKKIQGKPSHKPWQTTVFFMNTTTRTCPPARRSKGSYQTCCIAVIIFPRKDAVAERRRKIYQREGEERPGGSWRSWESGGDAVRVGEGRQDEFEGVFAGQNIYLMRCFFHCVFSSVFVLIFIFLKEA